MSILERSGYRAYAITNRSWEFKFNERPCISLRDMYKDLQSWRVELHIDPSGPDNTPTLQNLTWREMCGIRMPALAPVELFLGQGLHAYKHVCSEFFRASLLLEFRRHALARRNDQPFWIELADRAAKQPALRRLSAAKVPARLAHHNFEIVYHRQSHLERAFAPWFRLDKRPRHLHYGSPERRGTMYLLASSSSFGHGADRQSRVAAIRCFWRSHSVSVPPNYRRMLTAASTSRNQFHTCKEMTAQRHSRDMPQLATG